MVCGASCVRFFFFSCPYLRFFGVFFFLTSRMDGFSLRVFFLYTHVKRQREHRRREEREFGGWREKENSKAKKKAGKGAYAKVWFWVRNFSCCANSDVWD